MSKLRPSDVPGKKAGPNGSFPVGDPKHARLAIGGATHSYNAGNISKSTEDHIKAEARAELRHDGSHNALAKDAPKRSDPPAGRGSSARNSAGPTEDRADRADPMRQMGKGGSVAGPGTRDMGPKGQKATPGMAGTREMSGRGHMGDWADRMHPVRK